MCHVFSFCSTHLTQRTDQLGTLVRPNLMWWMLEVGKGSTAWSVSNGFAFSDFRRPKPALRVELHRCGWGGTTRDQKGMMRRKINVNGKARGRKRELWSAFSAGGNKESFDEIDRRKQGRELPFGTTHLYPSWRKVSFQCTRMSGCGVLSNFLVGKVKNGGWFHLVR